MIQFWTECCSIFKIFFLKYIYKEMPTKYRRRGGRKPFAKRRRRFVKRGKKTAPISSSFAMTRQPRGLFPNRFKRELVYQAHEWLDPSLVGNLAKVRYSCNGLFDVDITGAGHQPRGFDQMMAFYEHYTVIGSVIEVQFCPSVYSNSTAIALIARRETTLASNNDYTEYLEPGRSVWTTFPCNGGIDPKVLRMTWKPSFDTNSKNPLDEGSLAGSVSANPTKGSAWHICVGPADKSSDLAVITALIVIKYIVIFTDPKIIPVS